MQIKQCQLIMRMGSGRIEWQRAEAKWRRRPPVIFITCLRFYNCGQHHLLRVKWPLCYQSGNNEECGKWSALWPAQTPPTPGLISSFPPHNFSSLFFFFLCGRFYSVNVRNGDVIKTEDVVVQSHTRASISFHSYFLLLLPSLFFLFLRLRHCRLGASFVLALNTTRCLSGFYGGFLFPLVLLNMTFFLY